MVAPEQAFERYVTDERGSAVSRMRAARAEEAHIERWQRLFSHVGRASTESDPYWMKVCGVPSPEA